MSLIGYEIDIIDALRFNNDMDFLYRMARILKMPLNHEYWCEPEYTWQTNSVNRAATSDRLVWGCGVWGAQLQCIYYLVLYTDLKAAEGI